MVYLCSTMLALMWELLEAHSLVFAIFYFHWRIIYRVLAQRLATNSTCIPWLPLFSSLVTLVLLVIFVAPSLLDSVQLHDVPTFGRSSQSSSYLHCTPDGAVLASYQSLSAQIETARIKAKISDWIGENRRKANITWFLFQVAASLTG